MAIVYYNPPNPETKCSIDRCEYNAVSQFNNRPLCLEHLPHGGCGVGPNNGITTFTDSEEMKG